METEGGYMLTKKQLSHFLSKGYLVLDNFFTKKEISETNKQIEKVIQFYCFKNKIRFNNIHDALESLEKLNHDIVAEIYDTIASSSAFLRLQNKKQMQRTANQLLRKDAEDPLYVFKNRIRIDPPNDNRRTYGWHQEVFYTIPKSNFVQTWAPIISDTTIQNGTIELAPGTHLLGIPKQSWKSMPGCADQITISHEEICGYCEPIQLEMKLGQVVFFSGKTFHRSGNNASKEHRFSMISMWHDIENVDFSTPRVEFNYRNQTPEEYYKQVFDDVTKETIC